MVGRRFSSAIAFTNEIRFIYTALQCFSIWPFYSHLIFRFNLILHLPANRNTKSQIHSNRYDYRCYSMVAVVVVFYGGAVFSTRELETHSFKWCRIMVLSFTCTYIFFSHKRFILDVDCLQFIAFSLVKFVLRLKNVLVALLLLVEVFLVFFLLFLYLELLFQYFIYHSRSIGDFD